MRQPFVEQRADDETHAARFVEMVHIARTVRVDAGATSGTARDSSARSVQSKRMPAARAMAGMWIAVVGGATRGEQADRCVDDRLFVHHARQRTEILVFARSQPNDGVAARLNSWRAGIPAGRRRRRERGSPIISIIIWLELAVP